MSAEFEKVVLEKLTSLENNYTNLTSKVDNLSEELHETKEKVDNNTGLISFLSKKVDNNTKLISSLSKKVDTQGQNFARFEYEFNIKVQALFDSFVANDESHTALSTAIAALNAESFRHGVKISTLEDQNKSTKIFAHK